MPWLIIPSDGVTELARFVHRFASDDGHRELGLTNSQIVAIANDLKRKYGGVGDYRVHIWTRNGALKAYEPDREPNPL